MTVRIYIIACETEKQLVPTFKARGGKAFTIGQHIMAMDELETMTGDECRSLLLECVSVLPSHEDIDYKFPLRRPDPVPDQGTLIPDGDPGFDPDDWTKF